MKVYSSLNCAMHRFCIGVYVKAGCIYEPKELNGITHLYEHMVFRNIKSRYSEDFYELLMQNGLAFEAGTYKEFLYFTITGLPIGIKLATEILSHLFDDITIDKEDFRIEKNRVKAEIRESTEKQSLSYFADCEIWNGTTLKNTILGTCRTIDSISQKKINDYKNTIISSDNVIVYVTGNVDASQMKLIENAVSSMKVSDEKLNRQNLAPIPPDFQNRKPVVTSKNASYHRVRISVDIDNSDCPFDVRDMLYTTLFVDENALIFQELSENNPLVYSYDSVFEQYKNISSLKLEYEISKKNISESVRLIFNVFNRLKNGNFNFENNLQKLMTQWEVLQDDVCDLNWSLAYENHILGDSTADYNKEKFGRYANLTKEKVMNSAKKIFRSSNISLALKGDKKHIQSLNIEDLLKILDT